MILGDFQRRSIFDVCNLWTNNEGQVRCEARIDREQHRSSAPDDLRQPRRQGETRRTVDLGHSSDGPSWIDLTEICVNTTESRFAANPSMTFAAWGNSGIEPDKGK